jgi:DHA1 family bicyclomycin/chloramphenicol resistance-like MFS transporter
MRESSASTKPGPKEFVALMALLGALDALSIDSMLPALDAIGASLGASGNEPQLIITSIFLGAAGGQFVSGALSDGLGRRRVVFIFIAIFLIGTAICVLSQDFNQMLVGRVLQGFGVAGPQIISLAIIRDRYEGRQMARIASFVMSVFIIVPVIAPLMGQGVLLIGEWRAIFWALAGVAVLLLIWFGLRQPETLPPDARTPLSAHSYLSAIYKVVRVRQLIIYTGIQGVILGAFIGYLSSAQQIFQGIYDQGTMFPVLFALVSLSIAAAAALNGAMVVHFGMHRLTATAFVVLIALSGAFFVWAQIHDGRPPFLGMLAWLAASIFCFGAGFGNLTAIALEPLGDQAGIGATIYGGASTLMAVLIAAVVGQSFDGTILPLALGFIIAPLLGLALMWLDRSSPWRS